MTPVDYAWPLSGFLRSWKTWKSHGILKWLFPGLEKFFKKIKSQKFWKSHGNLLNSHVHLRWVWKKERNLNYKPAIFVGQSNNSWGIIHEHVYNRDFTKCLVMEILIIVLEKSWESIGENVYEPCSLRCRVIHRTSDGTWMYSRDPPPPSSGGSEYRTDGDQKQGFVELRFLCNGV